jgi:hypothetical protein
MKKSKHFPVTAPLNKHCLRRKRKVRIPALCLAALGTQKVAMKKE